MINNLFAHPALPLVIGSLLIFLFKEKSNHISIISILISLFILIFITSNVDYVYMSNITAINYFSYSKLAYLFCLVFLIMGLIGKLFSIYRDSYKEKAMVLLYISSAIFVLFSGDFLTLYIFWEIMAIASTMVIWSNNSRESFSAGNRYLVMHLLGGMILLLGIIGLYVDTNDLQIRLLNLDTWYNWMILVGFLLNAGAPPFSQWIPDAYPEGSYSSTVFLSAYTTKTSVFILIVTFAGSHVLMLIGIYMIMYGIVYALLENDIRRILAYSIVNQVGFMIVGIGIGTELSINGTAAHAFSHILYKGLLLMSAGSVIYMINKRKCTDVGGLYKTMPITAICGIVGALAISAFPLTSGFISKSMIVDASIHEGMELIWLMLLVGSAGVFLHAGIKFPWFVFFHKDKKIITTDPPKYMKYAMIITSGICIFIGVWPELLYSILPYSVSFIPYTGNHVASQLHILLFSALAFFISLKYLERTLTITLDIDFLYRDKIKYIKILVNFMSNMTARSINYISFINLRKNFNSIENYLMKQTTVSVMLIIILITFTVSLIMNIS
ncbi:MAG: Na(+)/H(+) antiporter subunit D [Gammaproteobacteria bacterium]|jgi:multicomponent Na+:H+ antiporter subunit D|nr:Na(+)/H(+) antiporter subunit D [Gammaproteobacteria bacterium]MBT4462869.1 Na(+)/H(+) antiporter subunit D [Gammaproteobacteria bacterium]MBT4655138.1 Na(+)/H(+) antiporter subunit D [Gammaproteobacteria bacterium]MBT5116724.1 Na(+)/H(+) antiporter subunit D [Gammaproteobacteria bacterium]MBT5761822.1 Na(+)/H(+) antiporter subunit D [Gammaproteobacteria bacterium]